MSGRIIIFTFVVFFISVQTWAQDFGFGFGDTETESGAGNISAGTRRLPSVSISGEVSAAIIGYLDDIPEGPENINTLEMFMLSGKLNFGAQSSFAEGVINLNLVPALIPVNIDEAYIRAFFGNFDFSAGLKKITWGKADQLGPLDVINFIDASKIFIEMADNTSLMGVKIANPVVHANLRFGQFSKIEGVFLPSFQIVSAAMSTAVTGSSNPMMSLLIGSSLAGRWMPAQMGELMGEFNETETSGLDYAQAGLRFTTTIGSADIGMQYFYGRMYQPAVKYNLPTESTPNPSFEFMYNKYHQIGIDYAQVLAGFNVRAEVAANITEDLNGNDGYIYNPSLAWSLGFDRDLFLGINLNMQVNGTARLLDSKTGSSSDPFTYTDGMMSLNPDFDIEAGASITTHRLTTMLSRKFLRDELELRTAVVWGIEDTDFAIIPALIWVKDDLRAALSGGFFLGDAKGQLGQYKNNNFLKISVAYTF